MTWSGSDEEISRGIGGSRRWRDEGQDQEGAPGGSGTFVLCSCSSQLLRTDNGLGSVASAGQSSTMKVEKQRWETFQGGERTGSGAGWELDTDPGTEG